MAKASRTTLVILSIILLASCSTTRQAKAPVVTPKPVATPIARPTTPISRPQETETPAPVVSASEETTEETVTIPAIEVTETATEPEAIALPETLPEAQTEETAIEEASTIKVPSTPFKTPDPEDITSTFNYAFGLEVIRSLLSQGAGFNSFYFSRGILDAVQNRAAPTLVPLGDVRKVCQEYIYTYLEEGTPLEPGPRPDGREELLALGTPAGPNEVFSYAYAFDYVSDLLYSDVEILADEFILGSLDAIYGTGKMESSEAQGWIDAYVSYLDEIYYKELADKALSNKGKAEAFLSENAAREEVRVAPNGIQIEILGEDEFLGEKPAQYETVLVDYNMYVLDYEAMDLVMIDADYFAEVSLFDAIGGFREAVCEMRVGQAARAYVPPELAYGAEGYGDIEPYTIVVYDIALNGIL